MPKISNNTISVYNKDIKVDYKIDVNYNQEFMFYALIPEEFKELVKHLTEEELKVFNIVKRYKNKRDQYTHIYDPIISSKTENECLLLIKKCLDDFTTKSITQRDVIIVFYNPKDLCDYGSHHYNQEHPQIGMQFGLTYAVETSLKDKKVYSIYPPGGHMNGCVRVVRKEISLWGRSSIIIPDSPANRESLENLYNAFINLNTKMK